MTETAAVDSGFTMELRISTEGLQPGMYVSQLDRPWREAGFALEGWMLRTEEDVRRVRGVCRYVCVDLARGSAPDSRFVVLDARAMAVDAPVEAGVEREERPAGEQGAPVPELDWASLTALPGAPEERTLHAVATGDGRPSDAAEVRFPSMQSAAHAVFGDALEGALSAHAQLESGIRDVMKAARAGASLDVASLEAGVDAMLDSLGQHPGALPWVLEMQRKHDYIYRHGVACSIWSATFGRQLGLERVDLRPLALAALLCDVGKVRLPTDLLLKVGPLDPTEVAHLRAHVEESVRIVAGSPGIPSIVVRAVSQHHERHDGSGYPRALRGAQIALDARIVGIVDSYDAMISDRAYAKRRSPHQAIMELYQLRDRQFEGALVEQFIRTCGVYPTGTLVELSDGRVAVVMAINSLSRLRPTVMLLLDENKQRLERFALLDLARVQPGRDGRPVAVANGLPVGAFGLDMNQLFLD